MRKCLIDNVSPNIEQFKCFYTTCFRYQQSGREFVKECLQSILAYCQTIKLKLFLKKHDKNKGLSFIETRPWLFDVRGWLMSVLLWKTKPKEWQQQKIDVTQTSDDRFSFESSCERMTFCCSLYFCLALNVQSVLTPITGISNIRHVFSLFLSIHGLNSTK